MTTSHSLQDVYDKLTREVGPPMPLVECTSWCDRGDGHPNTWCIEDQSCWSPGRYVELSHHPYTDPRDECGYESLGVMARRSNEATVVYLHLQEIQIGTAGGRIPWPYTSLDHSLKLTPDEADRLAAELRDKAELVRSQESAST